VVFLVVVGVLLVAVVVCSFSICLFFSVVLGNVFTGVCRY